MKPRPPVLQIVGVLPEVLLLLLRLRWLHPRRDLRALVVATASARGHRPLRPDRARTAIRLSGAIIRRLPRVFPQTCLYWSLAACQFLSRAGEEPAIHVGVRSEAGELLSHAWVSVDGEVVAGQPQPDGYHEMLTLTVTGDEAI